MRSDKLPRVLGSKPEQLKSNSSDVDSITIVHKLEAVMTTDEACVVPISSHIFILIDQLTFENKSVTGQLVKRTNRKMGINI